jgi:hypothetical protein
MSRLRGGERLALAGAIALAVSLFLSWFGLETRGADQTRYTGLVLPDTGATQLGWFVVLVCAIAVVLAVAMVAATALDRTGAAVMATVFTVTFGAFALALVLIRIVVDQPHLGSNLPSTAVDVRVGAYVGLAGAAALLAGAWWAMSDERTDTPYTPPPARPAPPAEAGGEPVPRETT